MSIAMDGESMPAPGKMPEPRPPAEDRSEDVSAPAPAAADRYELTLGPVLGPVIGAQSEPAASPREDDLSEPRPPAEDSSDEVAAPAPAAADRYELALGPVLGPVTGARPEPADSPGGDDNDGTKPRQALEETKQSRGPIPAEIDAAGTAPKPALAPQDGGVLPSAVELSSALAAVNDGDQTPAPTAPITGSVSTAEPVLAEMDRSKRRRLADRIRHSRAQFMEAEPKTESAGHDAGETPASAPAHYVVSDARPLALDLSRARLLLPPPQPHDRLSAVLAPFAARTPAAHAAWPPHDEMPPLTPPNPTARSLAPSPPPSQSVALTTRALLPHRFEPVHDVAGVVSRRSRRWETAVGFLTGIAVALALGILLYVYRVSA